MKRFDGIGVSDFSIICIVTFLCITQERSRCSPGRTFGSIVPAIPRVLIKWNITRQDTMDTGDSL